MIGSSIDRLSTGVQNRDLSSGLSSSSPRGPLGLLVFRGTAPEPPGVPVPCPGRGAEGPGAPAQHAAGVGGERGPARKSARSPAAAASPLMFWYAVRMRLTLELLHWAD
ncbi:uncharacterized protein LOC144341292 [Macaca mulatta]